MKKGFTLVELLAVIVILAIILAIAVPAIGNLIANSKKSMFANSAKLILKSMKNDYDEKIASTGTFTDTFILYDNGVKTVYPSSNNLDFTMSATDGGIVRHSDGTVTFALSDGTNCVVKTRISNDVTVSAMDKEQCISNILYKQASSPFENLVANGDFSIGTTGWSAPYSSLSVIEKVATIIGNGSNTVSRLTQSMSSRLTGNKYYFKSIFRTTSSSVPIFYLTATNVTITISNPVKNLWYEVSAIESAVNTGGMLNLYSTFATGADQNGKIIEFKSVYSFDLTTLYGAGNEPTKEQMDHNLNKVWIDTTTNTPKRFTAGGWISY